MILGISSFATFTTQAMEETGTQEVQSQSQDGADGEAQAQSSGDSVDRISFGTAFGDGNDAAILSPGEPTGYDKNDTDNPFGTAVGDPFTIFRQSELFTYAGSQVEATSVVDVNAWSKAVIYDTRKGTDASEVLAGGNWTAKEDLKYGDLLGSGNLFLAQANGVQTVSFDPTGSGRADHIAWIGLCKKDGANRVYVWAYNARNHRMSNPVELGTMNWVTEDTQAYQLQNYLSITAGDFDKTGKDRIVVYAAMDGETMALVELSAVSAESSVTLSEVKRGTALLNAAYMQDGDAYATLRNKSSSDGKYRLGCDLDAGDVNGDGIDDLAVISYTERFNTNPDPHPEVLAAGETIVEPNLTVAYGKNAQEQILAPEKKKSIAVASERKEAAVRGNEVLVPLSPTISIGNVSGNSYQEIVVSGIGGKILIDYNETVMDCVALSGNNDLLLMTICDSGDADAKHVRGMVASDALADGLTDGLSAHMTYPSMGTTAVAINGKGNIEYAFAGGRIYDLSDGTAKKMSKASSKYFEDSIDGNRFEYRKNYKIACAYISQACAAPVDGNNSGYEQLIFTAGTCWKATDAGAEYITDYTLGMIGVSGRNESTQMATEYYTTPYSGFTKDVNRLATSTGNSLDKGTACLICPVDIDDDGVLAKYEGKDFIYADPQVEAVLQAAPYFKELGKNSGQTSLKYTLSYEYEKQNDLIESYSLGFAGSVGYTTEAMKVIEGSLRLGYSGMTDHFQANHYSTEYTTEFAATGYDSVVLYRTPVTFYLYSIWNPEKKEWVESGLGTAYAGKPEYVQMSVSDYNQFVDKYNATLDDRYAQSELTKKPNYLDKLSSDLYVGNSGDPYSYYHKGKGQSSPTDLAMLNGTVFELGYNSGHNASEFVVGEAVTSGLEQQHGLLFDLTITGGAPWIKAGGYVTFENMWGTTVSKTKAESTGYQGQVENLDLNELVENGYTEEMVKSYYFAWQSAKWRSNLLYEYTDAKGNELKNKERSVPVYGYVLSDLKSPGPAVTDLEAVYDSTEKKITLNWTDANANRGERPENAGYRIYVVDITGKKKEIDTVAKGTTSYTYTELDGRYVYEFVIVPLFGSAKTEGGLSNHAVCYILNTGSGKSAYELAVDAGFEGTLEEWLASLVGATGTTGEKGEKGETGETGADGRGIQSITLTASENGIDTYTITYTDGTTSTFQVKNGIDGQDGADGVDGQNGKSAYELAQELGYQGSLQDWLNSLVGEAGQDGADGQDGQNGKSAYELAVENGYTGTESMWLASLIGATGATGEKGEKGETGETGADGRGIQSITLNASENGIDTYTITYTDDTTSTFRIKNGTDGKDGADGKDGTNGVAGQNGANGTNGTNGAAGQNGTNGANGTADAVAQEDETTQDVPESNTIYGLENVGIDKNGDLVLLLSGGKQVRAGHVNEDGALEVGSEQIARVEKALKLAWLALILAIVSLVLTIGSFLPELRKKKK